MDEPQGKRSRYEAVLRKNGLLDGERDRAADVYKDWWDRYDCRLQELESILTVLQQVLPPAWHLQYSVEPASAGEAVCTLTLHSG